MQVADFIDAAGVEPYAKAEDVLSARPGEVAALGEAFTASATALQSAGGLSAIAGQLADASAAFDGLGATDLMSEVGAVRESLSAGPELLEAIGAPLCVLAGEIATAQQQVSAALIELEETAAGVLVSYAQSAGVRPDAEACWNEHIAAGTAAVQSAYAAISATVEAHDARLCEVLLGLQAVGYLMPADVDAGAVVPKTWPGGSGNPTHAAEWWAGLSDAEQAAMIQAYPRLLGLMHGLPAAVHDAANRREIIDDRADISTGIPALAEQIWQHPGLTAHIRTKIGLSRAADIAHLSDDELMELGVMLPAVFAEIEKIKTFRKQQQAIEGLEETLAAGGDGEHRYLLEYDLEEFDGDGKAVIGIGEVDTADNVAVIVQGATHDLASISAQSQDAEAVLAEMDELSDEDNAVIVYEGYDNPNIIEGLDDRAAEAGGTFLVADLAGYQAAHEQASGGEDAHTTVIAHSYGTLTTGYALRFGGVPYIDDAVLYGSPGVGIEHVDDLGKDPEHIYIGTDPSDILVKLDALTTVLDWNHLGPDPATPRFGGTLVGTDGVDGHGDYFGYEDGEPNEALANAAAVAVDQSDEVVLAD